MDTPLPGFAAPYVRFDLTESPGLGWTLSVYWADGPGFVRADQRRTYEQCTAAEAGDILAAEWATITGW